MIIDILSCHVYLQSEWSISVELVVGPDVGISYLTEKASSVSQFSSGQLRPKESLLTQNLINILPVIKCITVATFPITCT